MSQPLTDAINALTTYANEITGKSDTTLSDAMESLVDGYGGGGDTGVVSSDYFSLHYAIVTVGTVSITNTKGLSDLIYGLANIPDDGTVILNRAFWVVDEISSPANNEVIGTSYNGFSTDQKVYRWRNSQWNSTPVITDYDAANPPSGRKYLVTWIEKETSEV